MRDSQAKHKTAALTAFGICLAGFLCYWIGSHDPNPAPDRKPRPGSHARRQQPYAMAPRAAFSSLAHPPQGTDGFEPPAFTHETDGHTNEARESTSLNESLYAFPHSINSRYAGQEIDDSVRELELSGTSQTTAELLLEITSRSNSKNEMFSRARSLAHAHPDPRIREQALTYLAELGNEPAINSVIQALTDPEPRIRRSALEALYRLGSRVPIQLLVDLAAPSADAELRAQVTAFVQRFTDRAAETRPQYPDGKQQ